MQESFLTFQGRETDRTLFLCLLVFVNITGDQAGKAGGKLRNFLEWYVFI